ncbi:MAG TPA: hypothetical protein VGQ03_04275 [Nitrososphaera sp.]|jgi:hypothetical protein|nr:hypothetical protein [Nitrososphaera sp.]
MEMFGSGPGKIPFETHLNRLEDSARAILLDLRAFVRSLGANVLEDVRPHRVVYSKTMNYRIFLDVEPSSDSLILSIRSGRSAPPVSLTVKSREDLDAAKEQIAAAFASIQ